MSKENLVAAWQRGRMGSPAQKASVSALRSCSETETCASLPRCSPRPMNMRCVASAEAVPAVWGCWVESPGSESYV